ncbi:MAG: helix-turn-helix domain-containing protein [Alphaproteobacteria bacterium]
MVAVVACAFDVGLSEISARTRSRAHIAFSRQVAMYLSHVVFGLNFTEVGVLFARDRTTAAYASRLIEDRRDDARLDLILDHLEGAICKMDNWATAFEARIQ